MKGIYLVVAHPDHQAVQEPGQPPSSMAAWHLPAEPKETLEQVVERHALHLPLGSVVWAVDDSNGRTFSISPALETSTTQLPIAELR